MDAHTCSCRAILHMLLFMCRYCCCSSISSICTHIHDICLAAYRAHTRRAPSIRPQLTPPHTACLLAGKRVACPPRSQCSGSHIAFSCKRPCQFVRLLSHRSLPYTPRLGLIGTQVLSVRLQNPSWPFSYVLLSRTRRKVATDLS